MRGTRLRVDVNGVAQGMFVKGRGRSSPVLLWVHGGPGMPDYFLLERYPTGLEELFTVVWWDQRGAGLSYAPGIPPATMTVEQFIADTLTVTDHLRERFGQDRIYLLGHSLGQLHRHPGGRPGSGALPRLHRHGPDGPPAPLRAAGLRPHGRRLPGARRQGHGPRPGRAPVTMAGGTPPGYLRVRDRAMHRLGIGTTRDMRSVITGIFLPSWRFPEYSLGEKLALWRGRAFSRSFSLWEEIVRVDLSRTVPELEVPVYFLHGAYDYTCSYPLAAEYLRTLRAPLKGFYRFGGSAHSPILEEPALAREILAADVLAATNRLADIR